MVNTRLKKLQRSLKTPLLIRNPQDLFYLTGHSLIDGGFLFISQKQVVLFGGFLENTPGIKTDFLRNIGKYSGKAKELHVDDHLKIFELNFLKKALPKKKLTAISSPVKDLRLTKDSDELKKMKRAYKITASVFAEVKKVLPKKQWREQELAQFIRLAGLRLGADDISFPVIVASGTNAAVPHHVPTNKLIRAGESIILDFGFKIDGYCSDFSRTVFLKSVPKKLQEIYEGVGTAYNLAVAGTSTGKLGKEVDGIARNYLALKKFDKYFIHSLGHGTGVDVHEAPGLHPKSEDRLSDGMVFSIEPGVYVPKLGGVRIEDLVYLEKGKAKYFQKVSTNLTDMII